ncbi:MAG TPA: serine/threonine-protein kinase, partial [Vicinamibacteria bacterium]|nr:serine/threonine-protein kinase [Vicinamibacteria bacterium]
GFSEDSRRGLLYLVMELAEGETLKRRLEHGAMPLPEALATFVPLAGGLEHAHRAGISHRDLKPSNIILTLEGPVLVDFGIAAAEQSGELTGKGHLGTLSYLPPEVFRGERAEPRHIDVYGLGLLLNEALTGAHPFPIESGLTPAAALATVGMRKLQSPALDPGEGAPEAIRDLIRRATDPDPKKRPDMGEMRRVLASLVERRGGTAAPTTGAPSPARVPAWSPPPDSTMRVPDPVRPGAATYGTSQTTSHSRRRFRERRKSVIVAWAASVIAAALLTALVIMMMNGSRGRQESLSPEGSPSPSARAGGANIKPVAPISPRLPSAPPTTVPATVRTTTTTTTTVPTPAPALSVSPRPSPRPSPSAVATPAPPAAEPPSPRPSPRPATTPHPSPAATPPAAEPPPPAEPTTTTTPPPSPSPPA